MAIGRFRLLPFKFHISGFLHETLIGVVKKPTEVTLERRKNPTYPKVANLGGATKYRTPPPPPSSNSTPGPESDVSSVLKCFISDKYSLEISLKSQICSAQFFLQ